MDDNTYQKIKENSEEAGNADPRWEEALNKGVEQETEE